MTAAPRFDRAWLAGDAAAGARALKAALSDYQDSVVRLRALGPALTELVRLRCARTHGCRICQTLRIADAVDAGVDETVTAKLDDFESSDLDERTKVALRITDAFITWPQAIDAELAAAAHRWFSDAELAELCLDITKWSTQKIQVSLGLDAADRVPVNAEGVSYLTFAADGAVAGYSAERLGVHQHADGAQC